MRKSKNKKKISRNALYTIILFVAGLAITFAANNSVLSGFQARAIQQNIEKLAEENAQLEIKATNLKSLQTLTNSVYSDSDFVKVQNMKHITPAKRADGSERASISVNP